MADPRDSVDISLSLIGEESSAAVNQLIAKMQHLDNTLKSIAIDPADQGNLAQTLKQVSDKTRGVIPTGSTTLADPMRVRYQSPSYNIESARSVSPIPEGQQRAKDRVAKAADEGTTVRTARGGDEGSRGRVFGVPSAAQRVEGKPPEWLQKIEDKNNLATLDEPVRMPRFGQYTIQDKLDLAAQASSQRALKQYKKQQDAARVAAEEAQRAQGASDAAIAAEGQKAAESVNKSSKLGTFSTYALGAAHNAAIAGAALPYAAALVQHLTAGGGLQDVTSFDPRLLHLSALTYPSQAVKSLQAIGQQSGYSAGSGNFTIPSIGPWGGRQAQNFIHGFHSDAAREGFNIAADIRDYNRQFTRVTPEQIASVETGLQNEGYRGAQRQRISHAAADVMQNTGIDPTILTPLMGDAVRLGNSNLNDLVDTLKNRLPDAAHRAGMSVNAATEAFHAYATNAINTQGASSVDAAGQQGLDIAQGYGISIPQAQELTSNPMVQNFAMLKSGSLPGAQGNLPGAAFGQASQSMLAMYGQAANAFAHPSVTNTAYGKITTSAQANKEAMLSKMTGIPVQVIKQLMDPKNNQRTDAESALTAYIHPGEGGNTVDPNFDPRQMLEKVHGQGLIRGGDKEYSRLKAIKDPHKLAEQLQKDVTPAGQDTKGSGLPGTEVTINLGKDVERYFNFTIKKNGGKPSKFDPHIKLARAGGPSSVGASIDPVTAAQVRADPAAAAQTWNWAGAGG